ncbi:hypothetical protein [Altererythrobacter fulvus]|uniref:hypothetical protein n=1 Tax=Caenibius fulvus TaxID=2126012 RepID=UPI0030175745
MLTERIERVRKFPNFKLRELPEEERREADSIRFNIGKMHVQATSFWAGRSLFHNCAERQLFDPTHQTVYHQWQLCAARDCAMSIYHFGCIISGIDESLGSCPTLRLKIDNEAKRAARRQFERQFPSSIALRHALAHSAERSKTAKHLTRHAKSMSEGVDLSPTAKIEGRSKADTLLLDDSIYGTTFSSMWDGQIIQCEVTEQSGYWLDEIVDAYWSAFSAIIDPNPEPPPTITIG